MERLCSVCNKVKNTPYKDICRNCYQSKWQKTIPNKVCDGCKEIFNLSGTTCPNCRNNKINEESRKIPCSVCHRQGLILFNKTKKVCITCHRKDIEEKDPVFKEKRRKQIRESNRRKRGTPIDAPIRKSKGFWITKQGYVMVYKPDHANSNANGCVQQHVLIMSEKIGRPLKEKETVHHKNGLRDDNRIENLELWVTSQKPGQRVEDKIKWAKEFLEEYGYEIKLKDMI